MPRREIASCEAIQPAPSRPHRSAGADAVFAFFEIVLVPMYFLIGGWGYDDRRYAALKFFLFTMFGSAFMLVGVVATAFLARDSVAVLGAWWSTEGGPAARALGQGAVLTGLVRRSGHRGVVVVQDRGQVGLGEAGVDGGVAGLGGARRKA